VPDMLTYIRLQGIHLSCSLKEKDFPYETRLQVLPRQQGRSDSFALHSFRKLPAMHSLKIKPGVARCSAARGRTFARSRCLLVRAAGESRPLALPSGPIFTSLRTRLEHTPGDNLLGRLYKVVLPGAAGYLPALLSPTATMLSTTGAVFAPPFLLDLAAKYLVHSDVRTTDRWLRDITISVDAQVAWLLAFVVIELRAAVYRIRTQRHVNPCCTVALCTVLGKIGRG